jgi:hypothetical protein
MHDDGFALMQLDWLAENKNGRITLLLAKIRYTEQQRRSLFVFCIDEQSATFGL